MDDWTTWKEGINYPNATLLGIGKKLFEEYPWSRFEPHPEWALGCMAAGIPGEVRFIYQPRRGIYNWERTVVKHLERDVRYPVFYFDPVTGRRFDQGTVMNAGPTPSPLIGHTKPRLFADGAGGFHALDHRGLRSGKPSREGLWDPVRIQSEKSLQK